MYSILCLRKTYRYSDDNINRCRAISVLIFLACALKLTYFTCLLVSNINPATLSCYISSGIFLLLSVSFVSKQWISITRNTEELMNTCFFIICALLVLYLTGSIIVVAITLVEAPNSSDDNKEISSFSTILSTVDLFRFTVTVSILLTRY